VTESRRLGRGLEALLGPISREQAERSGALVELPVGSIRPNPYQPRTRVNEPELAELAASIEASGLLQPIVVREADGGYDLIAGERRLRAVQRLGWTKIPAVVKQADDRTLLTLALIENLQRSDLSAIEEAVSYQKLVEEFKLPHGEVARLVGKDRSTVANALRLLKLPADVRKLVDEGALSEGHGRALLGLADEREILRMARECVAKGWSVRELEAAVRGGRRTRVTAGRKRGTTATQSATPDVRRVESALRKRLGTDVRVQGGRRGRGRVTISYYSNDDLARLLELILGRPYAG
jgi:ParB family chromosome partitioning protein